MSESKDRVSEIRNRNLGRHGTDVTFLLAELDRAREERDEAKEHLRRMVAQSDEMMTYLKGVCAGIGKPQDDARDEATERARAFLQREGEG